MSENQEGIEIIFFKPHSEYTYLYSINGIENLKIIDRSKIVTIIPSGFGFVSRIRELASEFKNFYVLFNPPTIEELAPGNEEKKMLEEIKKFQDKELYHIMENSQKTKPKTLWDKMEDLQKQVKNRSQEFHDLFNRF